MPWAQSIGIKPMRRRAPFLNPKAPDTPHHRFLRSMDKILRTSIRGKGVPFVADALHHGEILAVGSYRDVEVAVEHYSLRFADTQYREDVAHTIVAASGNAKFPLTVIRPREGLGAVIERTRLRELATGNAAFDRRWTVLSTRPERALEALQPPVLDRLMKPDAEGIEFTLDGNSILTVEPGYREDTDAFKQRLDVVTDVAHVMPGFMRDQGLPAPERRWGTRRPRLTRDGLSAGRHLSATASGWSPWRRHGLRGRAQTVRRRFCWGLASRSSSSPQR